jgi:hypothetical protein
MGSLLMVLYDMVLIPLSLFELPDSTFLQFMAWVTRMFWTIDLPLTFCSGFVTHSGHIELHKASIARRYLRTWFTPDFIIVTMDWLELLISAILANVSGVTRLGKVTRVFRIIRMIRLLRIARAGDIINVLLEQFSSTRLRVLFHLIKLCCTMLAAAHLLACLWYGCGLLNEENSWVIEYDYVGSSLGKRYIMSYRWAIAQFGGGMDEVHPRSSVECIYALFSYIGAFWSGAVFISTLTSRMTQLSIDGSTYNMQLNLLRQYLEQNKVSKNLSVRLNRNAKHALVERRNMIPEESVEVLTIISDPLRMDLHFDLYSPPLAAHPFFSLYIFECPNVIKKVCHSAMSQFVVSAGDTVFCAGETPNNPVMYIVNKGTLQYTTTAARMVGEGQWLSEACLWTSWMHRGDLTALSDCRLYRLDAREFQAITTHFEHGEFEPLKYAELFVQSLNNCHDGEAVTDTFVSEEALAEVERARWARPGMHSRSRLEGIFRTKSKE